MVLIYLKDFVDCKAYGAYKKDTHLTMEYEPLWTEKKVYKVAAARCYFSFAAQQ